LIDYLKSTTGGPAGYLDCQTNINKYTPHGKVQKKMKRKEKKVFLCLLVQVCL